MTFRVGQKVVCIDDSDSDQFVVPSRRPFVFGGLDGLTKGCVYTIRGLGGDHSSLVPAVYLVEIVRQPDVLNGSPFAECGFAACRFRPIVDNKTDIGTFTGIARKVSDSAPVIARNRSRIQAIAKGEH